MFSRCSLPDNSRQQNETLHLAEHFFNPRVIESEQVLDGLLRGLATQTSQKMDFSLIPDVSLVSLAFRRRPRRRQISLDFADDEQAVHQKRKRPGLRRHQLGHWARPRSRSSRVQSLSQILRASRCQNLRRLLGPHTRGGEQTGYFSLFRRPHCLPVIRWWRNCARSILIPTTSISSWAEWRKDRRTTAWSGRLSVASSTSSSPGPDVPTGSSTTLRCSRIPSHLVGWAVLTLQKRTTLRWTLFFSVHRATGSAA